MDQQSDCLVEQTANKTDKFYQFMKKTLQFLVLVTIFSSLYSYLSGFTFFFSYNLQFSTLIFPLVGRALDRKYMFLICNGILVFLAKSLRLSASSFNYNGLIMSTEDGVKQISELHPVLVEATVQENAASMEYVDNASPIVTAEEKDDDDDEEGTRQQPEGDEYDGEETKTGDILWDEDEEEGDEVGESRGDQEGDAAMEELNDARVSTEELNKKFEEFIRKMKEEIRIEAQQPLITV